MKSFTRKSYFNIVEIALALAVIGLGMASILALFPVGINASRSAIGNTQASEVAEEFMNYIRAKAEENDANYDAIYNDLPAVDVVNNFKADLSQATKLQDDETSRFLQDLQAGTIDGSSPYAKIPKWNNLFRNRQSDRKFLYIILQRVEEGGRIPDFSAALFIWKTPVGNSGASSDTSVEWSPPMSEIMAINIEVNWPLSKPYKDREKKFFYVIVKRP